jgi:hypothetical protein
VKTRDVIMLSAAMVVGAASIAAPAVAAASTLRTPVMLAQATPAPAATPTRAAASKGSIVDQVEVRIKDLHSQLQITAAQEDLWTNLTQVMRENAKTMDALRKARADKAQTMTAVEDFKSYGEITEVHADGIKKFVPVFSALYDSMSDAQKKNADARFRRVGAPKNMSSAR